MKMLIDGLQDAEPAMLAACLAKAKQWYGDFADTDGTATLTVNLPDKDGNTEYSLVLPYLRGDGQFFICCLRRQGSVEVEFHS